MSRSAKSKRIAVVGAGAAGLVSAREAIRQGHEVVVFEKSRHVGGVWVYKPDPEDDPLGVAPTRRVHSSLYKSLRTNLPRDLMAFRDYPFDSSGGGDDAWPRFIHHRLVLRYLENFARDFDLYPCIRFGSGVASVNRLKPGGWEVSTTTGNHDHFDAVMICNGHYSAPRVPAIPGMENFAGLALHSHLSRRPDGFAGKTVALFGAAASAVDISREIATVARQVYWCAEAFETTNEAADNAVIIRHPAPLGFDENGDLVLRGGKIISGLDAFIFSTGYHYDFPFLQDGIISVSDNWVHPLYLELIPPHEPALAFIGLPYSVIPFPLFEAQARWFSRLLAGKFAVPSETQMRNEIEAQIAALRSAGVKTRHTHKMADSHFAYVNRLVRQCGAAPLPDWFERLSHEVKAGREADPDGYRDSDFSGPY